VEVLAAVSGTYTAAAHLDVHDPALPRTAVTDLSDIPLLPVLPERDFEWIVTASPEPLERCATEHHTADVIEVPGGHVFETVDDTGEARDAVQRSIAWRAPGPALSQHPRRPVIMQILACPAAEQAPDRPDLYAAIRRDHKMARPRRRISRLP
jgi:hypothetical protein